MDAASFKEWVEALAVGGPYSIAAIEGVVICVLWRELRSMQGRFVEMAGDVIKSHVEMRGALEALIKVIDRCHERNPR